MKFYVLDSNIFLEKNKKKRVIYESINFYENKWQFKMNYFLENLTF